MPITFTTAGHLVSKSYFLQKIGQLPLVRRLGIPEYFLLVTQRITKYPVLIERIIQNTKGKVSPLLHLQVIVFTVKTCYKLKLVKSNWLLFVVTRILSEMIFDLKYFILVTAETDEYQSLVQGLALIKDIIFKVNAQVSEYEKVVRLSQRLEPKSQGRMKDGHLFRREDLFQRNRFVLHECTVTWKSSGRQKGL